MGTVPSRNNEAITFFSSRIAQWGTNAPSIGVSISNVTEMAARINTAQTTFAAVQQARNAAKDATRAFNEAMDQLRSLGGAMINGIRVYAETTGDPNVYNLASIPPISPPTPAGPPLSPSDIEVDILPAGGLRLRWKGSVSQSAYFSIYRSVGEDDTFVLLDSTDAKTFDDTNIPLGASRVEYLIQARREEFRINSLPVTVRFTGGGVLVSIGTEPRMAA